MMSVVQVNDMADAQCACKIVDKKKNYIHFFIETLRNFTPTCITIENYPIKLTTTILQDIEFLTTCEPTNQLEKKKTLIFIITTRKIAYYRVYDFIFYIYFFIQNV